MGNAVRPAPPGGGRRLAAVTSRALSPSSGLTSPRGTTGQAGLVSSGRGGCRGNRICCGVWERPAERRGNCVVAVRHGAPSYSGVRAWRRRWCHGRVLAFRHNVSGALSFVCVQCRAGWSRAGRGTVSSVCAQCGRRGGRAQGVRCWRSVECSGPVRVLTRMFEPRFRRV